MKKKKAVIWGGIGIFILLLCIVLILSQNKNELGRDKDEEFASGTDIKIEAISSEQNNSLYKLCKVWGYVKYRHPDIINGKINWDAELFRIMPEILKSENQENTNKILYDWLKKFPFEQKTDKKAEKYLTYSQKEDRGESDSSWIYDNEFLGTEVSEYLQKLSKTFIGERKNAYTSFEDNQQVAFLKNEKNYPLRNDDDGMKLLSLFRFWNIYEYYSPNVQITRKDWDEVLKEGIVKIVETKTYKDYALAIAEVAAQTGDAHLEVFDKEGALGNIYGKYYLQCDLIYADNRVVVNQVKKGEEKLKAGDILLSVDDMEIDKRIEELSKYKAIPQENKFLEKIKYQLIQTKELTSEVVVLRNGKEKSLKVTTSKDIYQYQNPQKAGLIKDENIGYIDPSTLEEGDLEKRMKEFADTKGIIVDLRYYPSTEITYLLAEYIIPEQKIFAYLSFSNPAVPGSYYSVPFSSGKGSLKDKEYPQYKGKIILLMNERSMSQSEFAIMSLRQSPNAVVIRSNSIGADGNTVQVKLPGDIQMKISGLGVYTPEREQTQRVGLKPDIEIFPTIEGIKEKRDEVLERGIAEILNK